MMSEHKKHTEFLKRCIHYDESARRQKLAEEILQIQRDSRCVQRAVWLMAILTALVVACFVYPALLVENFPYNLPQFFVNLILALGSASLISLLAFLGLGMIYRSKLDRRRDECRELVSNLLESRLGKPLAAPPRDNRNTGEDAGRRHKRVKSAQESLMGGVEQGISS